MREASACGQQAAPASLVWAVVWCPGCRNSGRYHDRPIAEEMSGSSASRVLGHKTDSIPFSPYHVLIIFILALGGFIGGYDLFLTGSLLVLGHFAA
jgi:hypothetical protein